MLGKDGWHPKYWTFMYYVTDFLALVNVVLQFYWTDYMLEYEFLMYGIQVFSDPI